MNYVRTKLDCWCEGVLEAGWLAALVIAPLFFNVFSSRVFEPDKVSLLRTIALVMALAWLIKIANGGYPWLPPWRSTPEAEPPTPREATRLMWRNPFFIPVVALIAAYLLSTLFSLAPFVSWFGSYQRLQGTYSFLTYVTIALLAASALRSPDQVRRLQHAVIVTSAPIAIYALIQHWGWDPLPWGGDTTRRVTANAGNAIFLAAYLIMAFFLTLERIYTSFAALVKMGDDAPRPRHAHGARRWHLRCHPDRADTGYRLDAKPRPLAGALLWRLPLRAAGVDCTAAASLPGSGGRMGWRGHSRRRADLCHEHAAILCRAARCALFGSPYPAS